MFEMREILFKHTGRNLISSRDPFAMQKRNQFIEDRPIPALDLPRVGGQWVKGVNSLQGDALMSRQRRTFTAEFKRQAVQLVTEQGFSVAEVARKLGVGENQIRQWKAQIEAQGAKAFPGHGNPVEAELHRLRAENKRLQQERDLLKKAAAFFAKESM